jgi:general stress protein YciG
MAHEDTLQTGLEPHTTSLSHDAANDPPDVQTPPPRRATGFALMDSERRKAIASQGGKAAHARGTAHRFDSSSASAAGRRAHERGTAHVWTPEAAREAGRKGGRAPRKPRISSPQPTAVARTSTPGVPPSSAAAG